MTSLVRLSMALVQLLLMCPVFARRLLVLPIDEKVIGIEAFLLIGLPLMIAPGGTHQIDLVILLANAQQFRIDRAGIDNMLLDESNPCA